MCGGHGLAVEVGAVQEVFEDAADRGQVADASCLQGVFEVGEGADDGDLEVVCPGGVGQFDG